MTQQTDPVCGMQVDPDGALESTYRGTSYYFCSDDCKTKWDADPAKYAKQEASSR